MKCYKVLTKLCLCMMFLWHSCKNVNKKNNLPQSTSLLLSWLPSVKFRAAMSDDWHFPTSFYTFQTIANNKENPLMFPSRVRCNIYTGQNLGEGVPSKRKFSGISSTYSCEVTLYCIFNIIFGGKGGTLPLNIVPTPWAHLQSWYNFINCIFKG